MSDKLSEFYAELMLDIDRKASVTSNLKEGTFFQSVIDMLIEDGHLLESDDEINGWRYTPFEARGLKVDGFEYQDDREILTLYLCQFSQSEELKTITKSSLDQLIRNLKRFFEKSLIKSFHESLEESSEAYEIAEFIYTKQKNIKRIKIVVITNHLLSNRIKELSIEEDLFNSLPTSLDVWDLKRIYDNEASKGKSESIEVFFKKEFFTAIPALSAGLQKTNIHSYLCIIPADILAALYERYGSRLLEANVRTFLQFRGKVNKGIRATIKNEPEMFFAYNNGITATANDIELDDNGNIVYLKNLQIVNGGQTTASIFTTRKKDKVNLSNIQVQMKLSIVSDELAEKIVPNISRYANSQNKISDSDFFSNHPFHRRLEEKSRKILTPLKQGEIRQTKWFYERARGQYNDELNKGSIADKKAFQLVYPKSQMFTKTDLAKIAVIFYGHPNHAVKGAQIAFNFFAKEIQSQWEKKNSQFNDQFYREIISKQILFNETRRLAMQKVSGNAIQPVTCYSTFALDFLAKQCSQNEEQINYQEIWNKSSVSDVIVDQLKVIINFVNQFFQDHVDISSGKTVLSFSKSKVCLDKFVNKLESLPDLLQIPFKDSLILKESNKSSENEQSIEDELSLLIRYSKISIHDWKRITDNFEELELKPSQIKAIQSMQNYLQLGTSQPKYKTLLILKSAIDQIVNLGFGKEFNVEVEKA